MNSLTAVTLAGLTKSAFANAHGADFVIKISPLTGKIIEFNVFVDTTHFNILKC